MGLKNQTMEKEYVSGDSVMDEHDVDPTAYPTEFLNTLQINGLPPHLLKIKVGYPVMLLRNINARNGINILN